MRWLSLCVPALVTFDRPLKRAAAVAASAAHPWASLPVALSEEDLILSSESARIRYNGLLPIEEQVRLQDSHANHIKALLAIITKYDMGNIFAVHSLHRHDAVPERTIRLQTDVSGIDGMKWSRATPITDELLAQDQIHATFFKVQGTTLEPLEFAMGPSPLKGHHVPPQFIVDMVEYLTAHDLAGLVAIEVGEFTKTGASRGANRTSELEVVWGAIEKLTVVLPFHRMVEEASNPIPTGWNAQDYDAEAEPDTPPAGEHWNEAKKSDGRVTHKVHVDSVAPITPELLNAALIGQGFVTRV
ncbi:hypothetical protein BT67DRAFT_434172 [Trichocladium antarcticum]|uniref:Uncharacterized protein n=1 Tax=Trichocladium antarcticum TaxID=1450529 RepID=A0AAN6UJ91_9PEZI|nr:hypothetical protein BT67DRAFT_434172 [Trichocladium antarcticum]